MVRTVKPYLYYPLLIFREKQAQAPFSEVDALVTGGEWTNHTRMGDFRYEITDPFDAQSVVVVIQRERAEGVQRSPLAFELHQP